jgi:hypothetical protein
MKKEQNYYLPPEYKSHLALLVDNWEFIQRLEKERIGIIPIFKQPGNNPDEKIPDVYHFDIQFLKAKAMEEMMEFLPRPHSVDDVYKVTRRGLEETYFGDHPANHPALILVEGLFKKLVQKR